MKFPGQRRRTPSQQTSVMYVTKKIALRQTQSF